MGRTRSGTITSITAGKGNNDIENPSDQSNNDDNVLNDFPDATNKLNVTGEANTIDHSPSIIRQSIVETRGDITQMTTDEEASMDTQPGPATVASNDVACPGLENLKRSAQRITNQLMQMLKQLLSKVKESYYFCKN